MNILTCVITHNRKELTERTIMSMIETRQLSQRIIVVDNASTDGTVEMLGELYSQDIIDGFVLNDENKYPGAACNIGWTDGLGILKDEKFTHLHRSDNDMQYLPGWDTYADQVFRAFPDVGQLGLMNQMQMFALEDQHHFQKYDYSDGVGVNRAFPTIGGTCIIPTKLWNSGLRWPDERWENPNAQEDAQMSLLIKQLFGKTVVNAIPDICRHMSLGAYDEYLEYHKETFRRRGSIMQHRFEERLEAERAGKYINGQRVIK